MTDTRTAFAAGEMLDSLGQAVIATDLDGVIVYWNAAAERLFGWSASETLGRNVVDVTVPQISQEVAADIMAALRSGASWSGGFPVQRRDGSVFPALVTDANIYRDGRPIGVIGVSANLGTALRPLLERSADAAIVLSAGAVVTYASPAVERLFGWRPDELIGKSLVTQVHPLDQEAFYDFLHDPPAADSGRIVEVRLESAGGWVPAECALTNMLDDPVVRGIVCNLRYGDRVARLSERERISKRLHADILQLLFAAGLDLDAVTATASQAQLPRIESAVAAIAEAVGTLRRIASPVADDDGNPSDGRMR